MFELDNWTMEEKLRVFSRPLNCGLSEKTQIEYEEPVSCYAEPNIEDAWQAREGWY